MEDWIPFLVWGLALIAIFCLLKYMFSIPVLSSIVVSMVASSLILSGMFPYATIQCDYSNIRAADTVKTLIALVSGLALLLYAVYHAATDNKQRIFCRACRKADDFGRITALDVVVVDDDQASKSLFPADFSKD